MTPLCRSYVLSSSFGNGTKGDLRKPFGSAQASEHATERCKVSRASAAIHLLGRKGESLSLAAPTLSSTHRRALLFLCRRHRPTSIVCGRNSAPNSGHFRNRVPPGICCPKHARQRMAVQHESQHDDATFQVSELATMGRTGARSTSRDPSILSGCVIAARPNAPRKIQGDATELSNS